MNPSERLTEAVESTVEASPSGPVRIGWDCPDCGQHHISVKARRRRIDHDSCPLTGTVMLLEPIE